MAKNYYRISTFAADYTGEYSGVTTKTSTSYYDFCPKGKEIVIGVNAMDGPRYITFYPPQK